MTGETPHAAKGVTEALREASTWLEALVAEAAPGSEASTHEVVITITKIKAAIAATTRYQDAENDCHTLRAELAALSPAAPELGAAVKPLDLANLLRHAFMFGFQTMGGTAEAAKDWWPVYDPEDCPAFERIRSALASPQQGDGQ